MFSYIVFMQIFLHLKFICNYQAHQNPRKQHRYFNNTGFWSSYFHALTYFAFRRPQMFWPGRGTLIGTLNTLLASQSSGASFCRTNPPRANERRNVSNAPPSKLLSGLLAVAPRFTVYSGPRRLQAPMPKRFHFQRLYFQNWSWKYVSSLWKYIQSF